MLSRRVKTLVPNEPHRRRPVREGLSRVGRSVRTLVRLNSRVVYQIPVRQVSVGFAKYGIIRVMKIDERCLPYAEYAELVAAIKSAL